MADNSNIPRDVTQGRIDTVKSHRPRPNFTISLLKRLFRDGATAVRGEKFQDVLNGDSKRDRKSTSPLTSILQQHFFWVSAIVVFLFLSNDVPVFLPVLSGHRSKFLSVCCIVLLKVILVLFSMSLPVGLLACFYFLMVRFSPGFFLSFD